MTICMSEIIFVTNRALCKEDFLLRIKKLATLKPAGILLREKDLREEEYALLAKKVLRICETYGTLCILHGFYSVAKQLNASALHLPMPILKKLNETERKAFSVLGASCHSKEEAMEAEALGCSYVTAGHIFETDCKKGLPARGLPFLQEVCKSVKIPVYAIGGINEKNFQNVIDVGAHGVCFMSGAMTCHDPIEYFKRL